jgi:hypothetical protein
MSQLTSSGTRRPAPSHRRRGTRDTKTRCPSHLSPRTLAAKGVIRMTATDTHDSLVDAMSSPPRRPGA